ncbi:MAG TPA: hypothetical protein VEW47_05385 [Candidatus Dormibacteraeota bacterium]|nr:hypothetical protein [Candidatus Dormibacteraeota bacterium]
MRRPGAARGAAAAGAAAIGALGLALVLPVAAGGAAPAPAPGSTAAGPAPGTGPAGAGGAAAPQPEQTPAAPAQAGAVRIEAAADRKTVTVGDPITVTVRLLHPPDARVTAFDPERSLGDLAVLGRQSSQTTLPDGRVQETRVLRVAGYRLGPSRIPSIEATVVDASGREARVATVPVPFTIGSVLAEGDTRPADIKNPAVMPVPPLWPFILLAAIAAAALAVWIWRRRRARGGPVEGAAPAAPPRPAHEIAYAELERLLASGLLEKGRVKEFYIELAEIVRRYFEARFGVDTFERTSAEILEALRLARLPAKGMALTAEFFGSCDLVKFAKHIPASDDTRAVVEKAYHLVDETRRREAVPADIMPAVASGAAAGGTR